MAPEIADSDDESDVVDSGALYSKSDETSTHAATSIDPVLPPQIDFDEYLEPTQALTDQTPIQDGATARGTGSTEKILQGLADARQHLGESSSLDNSMVDTERSISGKRRHSTNQDTPFSLDDVPGRTKRVRTYGSKSRSGSTVDLFADLNTDTHEHMPHHEGSGSAQPAAARHHGQQQEEVGSFRQRDRPRRVISLLEQSINAQGHQLSTTVSSYGGYQSIDLDFRGFPNGLDINANPFAGLSQVSLEQDAEARLQDEVEKNMMTSPERHLPHPLSDSINPAVLEHHSSLQNTPATERGSSRRKTHTATLDRATTPSPATSKRRAASVSAESVSNISDKGQSKKRGRKAKSSKPVHSSQHGSTVAPELLELSVPKRSRRGTLESAQQTHDETPSNTKRKRKKSESDAKPAESSPVKHHSSELNLSDEQLIGLPKENYKPRPSRRRSRPMVEESEHKSDRTEQLSGIPEDSLIEPVAELHASQLETLKENTISVKESANEGQIETPPEFVPPKTSKKSKKSKVKRAKTSAAALLRRSADMLSEGDDDVLWVDEKPAAVKLELPPSLKSLKKEADAKVEDEPEATTTPRKDSKISIEIPFVPVEGPLETKAASGDKKKRGRPRKSGLPSDPALDRAPTPEPLTEAEHDEDEDDIRASTHRRQILGPKSNNLTTNTLPTPAKSTTSPKPATDAIIDKENALSLSPSNHRPPSSTPSPTKGPTTHSPIKPPRQWNSKSRYRVGLSKRQSIPSLLRKVDKTKSAPTKVGVKVQERKIKNLNEDLDSDDEGNGAGKAGIAVLRDKNGELVEWEF